MPESPKPRRRVRIGLIAGLVLALLAPTVAWAADAFDDVPDSNVFHEDIAWLAGAGVTKGCNPPANTEFCPSDNVTRGQMAAFMRRFAQYIDAEDGTPGQADNANTLDGFDATDFVLASEALAQPDASISGDTITWAGGRAVTGVTTLEETTVDVPADGFLFLSANTSWDSAETNILTWVQIDNTTCNNSATVVASVGYGYALTAGTSTWGSGAFAATAPVTAGNHTVTLCGNPFSGNLSPNLRGAAVQAIYVAQGSVTANLAGSIDGAGLAGTTD